MITGSRTAESPARPLKWRAAAAGRIALMVLRFTISLTGWAGGAILASRYDLHLWGLLIGVPIICAGMVAFFLPLRIDDDGHRSSIFWTCRTLAVICAFVMFVLLQIAVQNQELHEHGVVEKAVVIAQSSTTSATDGSVTYHYSLRALGGPVIHGTLDTDSTISVGEHITVLADPSGLASPTLDTHVSASGELLAADVIAGIIAVLVAVTAWSWPQRRMRR